MKTDIQSEKNQITCCCFRPILGCSIFSSLIFAVLSIAFGQYHSSSSESSSAIPNASVKGCQNTFDVVGPSLGTWLTGYGIELLIYTFLIVFSLILTLSSRSEKILSLFVVLHFTFTVIWLILGSISLAQSDCLQVGDITGVYTFLMLTLGTVLQIMFMYSTRYENIAS